MYNLLCLLIAIVAAQNGVSKWSTYVTSFHGTTIGNLDGGYGVAQFSFSYGNPAAFDRDGNMYIGERGNGAIKKITPAGQVTTIVTGLNHPIGLAVDDAGQVWFCDSNNHQVKVYSNGIVITVAGSGAAGNLNGQGTSAQLNCPVGLVLSNDGFLYVTEFNNNLVRKINRFTFATSTFATGFYQPTHLVMDSRGNLIVVDAGNSLIRKVTPDGIMSTFAGSTAGFLDGQGTNAKFNQAVGICIDKDDYMYVTDRGNHVIRMISPDGIVSTIVGTPGVSGMVDGVGSFAKLGAPEAVSLDPEGNLIFTNNYPNVVNAEAGVIKKIYLRRNNPMAMISYAHAWGSGAVDGVLAKASFNFGVGSYLTFDSVGRLFIAERWNQKLRVMENGVVTTLASNLGSPVGVDVDNLGNVYVSDEVGHKIYRITLGGAVTTIAGSSAGFTNHATGTSAQFNVPHGIRFDGSNSLYVTDFNNHCIRKMSTNGTFSVSTHAGVCTSSGYVNGNTAVAKFKTPMALVFDSTGNLYIVDRGNHAIRIITTYGQVKTFAGRAPSSGVGLAGFRDGYGPMALFYDPFDIAIDKFDNLYVADYNNHRIRMITPDGLVTTIAGNGVAGTTMGYAPLKACLNFPFGIAVSPQGDLYSIQANDDTIRRITLTTNIPRTRVSWFAGTTAGSVDGPLSTAQLGLSPDNLDFDTQGNAYVTEFSYHKVRKISNGAISTIVSSGCTHPLASRFDSNGILWVTCYGNNAVNRYTKTGTLLNSISVGGGPHAVVFDSKGVAYIATNGANTIARIDPMTFVVTTFVGSGAIGTADGKGTSATFQFPRAMDIDAFDNLYVTDQSNSIIRKVTPDGVVTTIAGVLGAAGSDDGPGRSAKFNWPVGVACDNLGNVFIGDAGNQLIRMITPDYNVYTIAGITATAGNNNDIGPLSTFNSQLGMTYWNGSLYVMSATSGIIQKITLERDWYVSRERGSAGSGTLMDPFSSIKQLVPKVNVGDRIIISDPSILNGNPASSINTLDYYCNPSSLTSLVGTSPIKTMPLTSTRNNQTLMFYSRMRTREQNSLSVWTAHSYSSIKSASAVALLECKCSNPKGCGARYIKKKPTVAYCSQKLNNTCVCTLPLTNMTVGVDGYSRGSENGVPCVLPKKTDYPIYQVVSPNKRYCTHKLNGNCVCVEPNKGFSSIDANGYEWLYENGSPCIVPKVTDSPLSNGQIDCIVSSWSSWGACSASCGGGVQTRTRSITTQPSNGGTACPTLTETQTCNTQLCPLCTGGTVSDINGFRIHKYTTVGSSTFQCTRGGTMEVLVVGGGGPGGLDTGGGGGGGGVIYDPSYSISTSASLIVVVGAGGSGGGGLGGYSRFDTISVNGGGGGATAHSTWALSGGSGGGGSAADRPTGAAGTNGQGYAGGSSTINENSGGGGGAGGPGGAGTTGTGCSCGNGGPGLTFSISGVSATYGGGGGGGTYAGCSPGNGGIGGGGSGGLGGGGTGSPGTPNTGGGGGGAGWSGSGSGAGGSGIVIIRYSL